MAMMRKSSSGGGGGEGNVFWVTMSDLMLGLAIIFMTLFVLAMTGFTQESIKQKQQQIKVSQELQEQLKKNQIDAEIDKLTGDIKISDLELFNTGSYVLSPGGKALLNKLMPIYINTIFEKKELISGVNNIVIQGHTDSQAFSGARTKEEHFVKNMDLSTKRANAVAEYMFKTNYDKRYSDDLIRMVVVEGKSFTEPILTDGKEDLAKSRRVEMRLKVKSTDIMQSLFGGVQYSND
ncbi:MAG: OmpA family protein [Heliobacteriaceae bacterium]|jgi:chemotaxis protein MotB|nr:OmpA family protein [Heliobacteriaceae bacterium]